MKERINKFLASHGISSRREADKIIESGNIKVLRSGKTIKVELGIIIDTATDKVYFKNKLLQHKEKLLYFKLNKPIGYICSSKRTTKNQKICLDLFPNIKERIYTVGRLDKETSGLLLLTNDGNFSKSVIHPSSNIQKEYLVTTTHTIKKHHIASIKEGIIIDGVKVTPFCVKVLSKKQLSIVIYEGKNREIRRLMTKASLQIDSLKRIRIGNLLLKPLLPGEFLSLTQEEKATFTK